MAERPDLEVLREGFATWDRYTRRLREVADTAHEYLCNEGTVDGIATRHKLSRALAVLDEAESGKERGDG